MHATELPAPIELVGGSAGPRKRLRVPIALVLVGGVSLLILVAVTAVLSVSLAGAGAGTISLLRDKADLGLQLLEARVRGQLDPVQAVAINLAETLADDSFDAGGRGRSANLLRGMLGAVSQVTAISYIDADNNLLRAARAPDGSIQIIRPQRAGARVQRAIERRQNLQAPAWSAPVWNPSLRQPTLNFVAPVRSQDDLKGVVIVSVALGQLAEYMAQLEKTEGMGAFILYDQEHVLAHPALLDMEFEAAGRDELPLPVIADVPDPAFALLQGEGRPVQFAQDRQLFSGAFVKDGSYVILREITGLGPRPWQLGLKFKPSEFGNELQRLTQTAVIGFAILLVAVALGFLLGRHITRQIGNLAKAAERLRTFDFAHAVPVPDSRIRELSHAADAFNAMVGGMRWFEAYVPRSLVLRLMNGGDGAAASQKRDVTVMFTDIRGFSTIAEHMDAADTAALLNRHFELLSARIEAEGGTVDKFIGDSVMAFWGAPEDMADHAKRALAAARAIRHAVEQENRQRRAEGEPPIAIRIGIHTGPVVVGNIGSASRINYTIVGDTVNTASRLEALAGRIDGNVDCVTLVSDATAKAAGLPPDLDPVGDHAIRGRSGRITAYRLTDPTD